jgi:hypothetical protein
MNASRRGFFGLLAGLAAAPYTKALAPLVAPVAPVVTATYSRIGIREDLSDAIYNISPTETPMLAAIRRSAPARVIEWQRDALIGR